MRYEYLIFIGRFQPFHLGHEHVVLEALKLSEKIIILAGSPYEARTIRNPWSFNERDAFIRANFSKELNERILISPIMDNLYNESAWIESVRQTALKIVSADNVAEPRVGLIGHEKDASSYYLLNFPEWKRVEVQNYQSFSSTDIRKAYFEKGEILELLSDTVSPMLERFKQTQYYEQILEEYRYVKAYKKDWGNVPYAPVFVTVDALVIQNEHILLIKRKETPGRGLVALPGGFINNDERLQDAVLRELKEETQIDVPVSNLQERIVKTQMFDDPNRSSRGRTITHAYLIELAGEIFPVVMGADDADKAFWMPLCDIESELMFEDHYHIIQAMLENNNYN